MFSPKYSEKQVAASQARAADAGFTENDERVYAESIFALVQFAQLAFRTDGVDEIMKEIADSPTLFSGAFTNLDWNNLQPENGAGWGLPGIQVFRLPYRFLSKTKARGNFYVTTPRPPLQNVAGIIGLTVDETSKTTGKRLTMRVLAGRRAARLAGQSCTLFSQRNLTNMARLTKQGTMQKRHPSLRFKR